MPDDGLYIQLFSIHGLIRGISPELGRDADTGGQIKYVLELAKSLGEHPEVAKVDLFTRLIHDKVVSSDYSNEIEPLSDNVRIVRLQCGGRKYIRKELLWPHLEEFIDKTLKFIKSEGMTPDIFHGHYADGGYVARELASIFSLPFIFTGHSMGRHKKMKLLKEGSSPEEISRRYKIDNRISVEERIIKAADLIITSTRHEIINQYSLYESFEAGSYSIIPPGIDLEIFYPYYNYKLDPNFETENARQTRVTLLQELHRFWIEPQKPFILALCRPDQRKNISGLITAYAEDKELQAIANLAIFAGIRKDIKDMEENERDVLTKMLLQMDSYDLYGKLAIPKKHDFTTEVPELYRLCADSGGIFVNPALIEPFGLTLIEAAACGLPIIATREGGPADIIENCNNGTLIDPTNPEEISKATRKILVDKELWEKYSKNGINGVRQHYSWNAHCEQAAKLMIKVQQDLPSADREEGWKKSMAIGHRLTSIDRLLISDIDNTLVGDESSLDELLSIFRENNMIVCWGVATGRSLDMTLHVLEKHHIPVPDILVCSVGTEIYYGPDISPDKGWQQHLIHKWRPEIIREVLSDLTYLNPQEGKKQRKFKISYYMEDDPDQLAQVHKILQENKLRYHLIYSHGQFLDILPYRASKGKAIRYLSYKWEIPISSIMVCGDSGNDTDMLRGDTRGVVVANFSKELEALKGHRNIFFSGNEYAAGIIDGIRNYNFLS